MDSKDEHDAGAQRAKAGPTENSDTSAMQKKKARRVSFAEMTSIHFFDRDEEDNETPVTGTEKIAGDSADELGFGVLLGGNKEFGGEDEGYGSDDDEEMVMRRSFLRPVGSPSPGGSTLGSASSNDEDNFFGPVSANFIRPGRLSDSMASDDNRDVTMDSTTFSMHYRSLALSDSGVDLKTPTGIQHFSEEKTPSNAVDVGSSMVITLGKKPIPKTSPIEASGGQGSSDMSLVGGNFNKYDYERLSPRLDALLAESRKNLLSVSVSDDIITSTPPIRKENAILPSIDDSDKLVNPSDFARKEAGRISPQDMLNGDDPAAHNELGDVNAFHGTFHSAHSPPWFSSSVLEDAASKRDNNKPNRSPYQLSKDESATQQVSSTSPVRQQQIELSNASPSKSFVATSPVPERSFSLLRSISVEHQEIQTSIQKSISKLESLERSAFSSAFSAKVDKSTIRSLDFVKSPNFDSFLGKNHHISGLNEDSFAVGKLTEVSWSKERRPALSTVKCLSGEKYWEEHLGQIMSRKSPNELSAKILDVEQSKYRGLAGSPTKNTWSGNNLKRSLFTSRQSDEDALVTDTESLLAEIASGKGGNVNAALQYGSSPDRMLEKIISASEGLLSGQSEDISLCSQLKQISDLDEGKDSVREKNPVDGILSAVSVSKDAATKGTKGELSSPFAEVNNRKSLVEINANASKEVDIYKGKEILGASDKLNTPNKENKYKFTNVDVGNQTDRDSFRFENNQPGRKFVLPSDGSVSPYSHRYTEEPRLQNQVGLPTTGLSRDVLDNCQSTKISSPTSTQLNGGLENVSSNKRNIELLLRDTHRTEMPVLQRSPKIQKGGSWFPQASMYPSESRTTMANNDRKKWLDTYSKFSEDMKTLISSSSVELDSKMIDVLEDLLVFQQRSKRYEMLCLGVMPQGKVVLEDCQLEKVAETNSLLHQVVFQKAKLQLKHVKKERLLKRLQFLSTRIHESEVLKANIAPKSLEKCTSNSKHDAIGDLPINVKKRHAVFQENLTTMRQELEALNKKILNLTRTLQSCCKMKAEPSCGKTIALVNEHLLKRASCRFLLLDMQMWSVHSVGSSDGHHNVVLNYLDFIIQSIKVIVGPSSSATYSFKLNETNILKNFPNMDACIAFAFVFSAETTGKYIGTKTLAQETQVTSSILGTLLDVAEEVQLAQMEFHDLTQSSFCSPSVERLDLMLSFYNFYSGIKVSLTLDISCLKRGIYPSEILPHQMTLTGSSQKSLLSCPILESIRAALKDVRSGYTRILRLCRCVSQVVQGLAE